jgi:hypothetical protein
LDIEILNILTNKNLHFFLMKALQLTSNSNKI